MSSKRKQAETSNFNFGVVVPVQFAVIVYPTAQCYLYLNGPGLFLLLSKLHILFAWILKMVYYPVFDSF
jgi:hypothetical protein